MRTVTQSKLHKVGQHLLVAMSIHSWLVPKKRDIPDLEKVVSSSMAEAVRKEISSSAKKQSGSIERKRGLYEKITPVKKAKIAKYAAENGKAAALQHFKTKEEYSQIDLKESTVRGWKKLYCDTLSSKSRMGDDKLVKELPAQSVGRLLLL